MTTTNKRQYMNIIEKKTTELIPYENNPRNNDGAVDAVAASIKEFGFKVPIVIDKDGVIVAGHTRLKAAKKLGLETVPCIIADDLSEEQIKAFRLADNKAAELAEWDFEKLELEMMEIKTIPLESFGFAKSENWFERENRNDDSRQEGNDEYNAFLDKFEDPKTTDDCYTPDNIYEVVAQYVEGQYGVNRKDFVRPFFPGGDFEKFKYPDNAIVVDNPPFSILSRIYDFYIERGIKFFLFAPQMTSLGSAGRRGLCLTVWDSTGIVYENGAIVPTAFVTNLDEEYLVRSEPELAQKLRAANEENQKQLRRELPKYEYPDEVLTAAKAGYLSRYGQALRIRKGDGMFISKLDAQKEQAIFGGGLLLSEKAAAEKAAAEKAAAEKAAAEKWTLSDREKAISKSLGGGENE